MADELDHIVALTNGGADESDNRQGLCKQCHADKTLIDLGRTERTQFDASGRVMWPDDMSGPTGGAVKSSSGEHRKHAAYVSSIELA